MRSPGTQGALSTLVVFYIAAFAAFLLWAVLSLPDLFPVFKWPYLWASAFVRFVDYAIPVTVAGLAVAYSLFMRAGGGGRRPFHKVVGSQLTLLVALTVLYTAVLLGFYPRSRTLLTELEELTRQGRALLATARRDRAAGRPQEAFEAYGRYLAINRRDEKAAGELDELRVTMHSRPPAVAVQEAQPVQEPARGERPEDLLAKARGYYEREEWFSAVYFADQAVRVSGDRQDAVSRDAARLSAKAWEQIRSQGPGKRDTEQRELFDSKKKGYDLLQKQDYLAAYYHFLELSRRYPQDQDARRYLADSRGEVVLMTYFLDEAERVDPLPGAQGLLFLNPRADKAREIVSIGKMTGSAGGTFFKDIEVLRILSGRVVLHYRAPYGKLELSETPAAGRGQAPGSHAGILLHGIDRDRPGQDIRPLLIAGSLRGEEPRYLLQIDPAPRGAGGAAGPRARGIQPPGRRGPGHPVAGPRGDRHLRAAGVRAVAGDPDAARAAFRLPQPGPAGHGPGLVLPSGHAPPALGRGLAGHPAVSRGRGAAGRRVPEGPPHPRGLRPAGLGVPPGAGRPGRAGGGHPGRHADRPGGPGQRLGLAAS